MGALTEFPPKHVNESSLAIESDSADEPFVTPEDSLIIRWETEDIAGMDAEVLEKDEPPTPASDDFSIS
jgi:hypothetical protein